MNIDGIDKAVGMEMVNYDEELFEEILHIYYEDGIEMLETLRQNLQHSDLKLFITHIHAMKSASCGIGAVEMSELFKEIEFAGKEDFSKIEECLPSCLAMFEQLLSNLKDYFADGSNKATEIEKDVMKRMDEALEQMDTDTFENLLSTVKEEASSNNSIVKWNEIQKAYEDFDYDFVKKLLTQ